MLSARMLHSATLLQNGRVLIAGGGPYAAELYDPATKMIVATGTMKEYRSGHAATLLPDGRVLIIGGSWSDKAELYDPATGNFTYSAVMPAILNQGATATVLKNGKVLVVGFNNQSVMTTSIYDPAANTFTATGTAVRSRVNHSATLLPDGRVLIAGGLRSGYAVNDAEVYDPASGQFSLVGTMLSSHGLHKATLLANGKVLVAGEMYSTPELFDPATNQFSAAGSTSLARIKHAMAALYNGKVLLAGGTYTNVVEEYDPATSTFAVVGDIGPERDSHTATLLPDGNLLIAGGRVSGSTAAVVSTVLLETSASVKISPASNQFKVNQIGSQASKSFSVANAGAAPVTVNSLAINSFETSLFGPLPVHGGNGTQFTMQSGTCGSAPFVIAPGDSCLFEVTFTADSLGAKSASIALVTNDPETRIVTVPLAGLVSNPVTVETLLTMSGNGRGTISLFQGAIPPGYDYIDYYPFASCNQACYQNLAEGSVVTLVADGQYDSYFTGWTGCDSPNSNMCTFTVSGNRTFDAGFAIRTYTVEVTVAQGMGTVTPQATVLNYGTNQTLTITPADGYYLKELYDNYSLVAATPSPGNTLTYTIKGIYTNHTVKAVFAQGLPLVSYLKSARESHSANLLADGTVLVIGGRGAGSTALSSAEIFNPATSSFSLTGSMAEKRFKHTATALADGRLLIIGGDNGTTRLRTTEIFNPTTKTFSAAANMTIPRAGHSATRLLNGKILIVGGNSTSGAVATAELYDPATGLFQATGSMATPRMDHAAVMLADGRVLVFGGTYNYTTAIEIYNPATGTFSAAGNMVVSRNALAATLLSSGKVLLSGGGGSGYPYPSAELYDPATGTSSGISHALETYPGCDPYMDYCFGPGDLYPAAFPQTATINNSGNVIIAGGGSGNATQMFEPSRSWFTPFTSILSQRYGHTATLLPNGSLLVIGGFAANEPLFSSVVINFAPVIQVTPDPVAFQKVFTGIAATKTVTVANNGSEPLTVNGFNFSGADAAMFTVKPGTCGVVPFTLAQGGSCTVDLQVLATRAGVLAATLETTSNDPERALYPVQLSAEAVTPWSLHYIKDGSAPGRITFTPGGQVCENNCTIPFEYGTQVTARFDGNGYNDFSGWSGCDVIGLNTCTVTVTAERTIRAIIEPDEYSIFTAVEGGGGTITPAYSLAKYGESPVLTITPYTYLQSITDNGNQVTPVKLANGTYTYTIPTIDRHHSVVVTFSSTPPSADLAVARSYHSATLLADGQVLLGGGYGGVSYLDSVELYNPATAQFTLVPAKLSATRHMHTAIRLASGKVLFAGGVGVAAGTYSTHRSAELYDPATKTFTGTGDMVGARHAHTATLLRNGKILLVGGYNNSALNTAEVYDPASGTFTATGSMATGRYGHTTTLLLDGKVLITGGVASGLLNTAELYDPVTGQFTTVGTMQQARYWGTATLLSNGKVLIAGGYTNSGRRDSSELYDPATRTFTAGPTLTAERASHSAVLLHDGTVQLAGGYETNTVEVYDPVSNSFTAKGAMGYARSYHSATVLASGKVLIAGGSVGSSITNSSKLLDAPAVIGSDNFETGAFLRLPWTTSGHGLWTVKPSSVHGGTYSAEAPVSIVENQSSTMQVVQETTAGTISFWFSTSSEANFDFLTFYIDGVQQARWSGGIGWTKASYPVAAGKHTFAWVYSKDGSVSAGADTVWIDDVAIPTAAPALTVSPSPVYFGQVLLNDAPTANLTIANNGTGPLEIAALSINGLNSSEFTLVAGGTCASLPFTVAPQNSCTQKVRFTSAVAGNKSAVFNVATTTPLRSVNVPLNATAVTPVTISVVQTGTGTGSVYYYPGDDNWYDYSYDFCTGNCSKAVPVGSSYKFYASPAAGYSFVSMSGCVPEKSTSYECYVVADTDRTIQVQYAPQSYVVTTQITEGNGTVDPANAVLPYGGSQVITITPAAGSYVRMVYDNGAQVNPEQGPGNTVLYRLNNVYWNHTIKVSFAEGTVPEVSYLATARTRHSATLLNNGKVLIAGGETGSAGTKVKVAELYDPATGVVTPTGSMVTARSWHSAVLLNNGKVLLVGGRGDGPFLASAELYDPISGTFTAIGSMKSIRWKPAINLLDDGKVLIAGGTNGSVVLSSAEIFDPANNSFTLTGAMTTPRSQQTSTKLANGKVLVTSGNAAGSLAEVYDPITGIFTALAGMTATHTTATTLADGRVLLAGGSYTPCAEIYDPATNQFTALNYPGYYDINTDSDVFPGKMSSRHQYTATANQSGRVFFAGGNATVPTEIFDPAINQFIPYATIMTDRNNHTATLLQNGRVLIVGGEGNGVYANASIVSIGFAPQIVTSKQAVDFGRALAARTTTQAVEIKNAGAEPLQIAGAIITGTDAAQFGVTSDDCGTFPATIAIGASCTLNVSITPTGLGNKTAALELQTNDPKKSLVSMPLTAVAVASSTLSMHRDSAATNRLFVKPAQFCVGACDNTYNDGQYCNGDCTMAFETGTAVTVVAEGATGQVVNGWSGCDANADPSTCTVNMTENKDVSLLSSRRQLAVAIQISGGKGTVTPATGTAPYGEPLILTITPESGSYIKGISANGRPVVPRTVSTYSWASSYEPSPTIPGAFVCTITNMYEDQNVQIEFAVGTEPMAMLQSRYSQTAVKLKDGRVLLLGGWGSSNSNFNVANEIYDPVTRTFTSTGTSAVMNRNSAAAALLHDGRVLIVGGYGSMNNSYSTLSYAEIFDPATGIFTPTGTMKHPRFMHTATTLADGRVLVVGGANSTATALEYNKTSELFDPATGTFTETGLRTDGSFDHTATLLSNGRVLIVGGMSGYKGADQYSSYQYLRDKIEEYDPASGQFSHTATMADARRQHTATLLKDGNVLIAGGNGNSGKLSTADIYHVNYKYRYATGLLAGERAYGTATLLSGGKVLLAGGNAQKILELYDPATGNFSSIGSLDHVRSMATATRLDNGSVLIAGGIDLDKGVDLNNAILLFDGPPAVNIYAPVNGETTADNAPVASYATSYGSIEILLDDALISLASGARLPALTEGDHRLKITVTDPNEVARFAEVNFSVDTIPPVVQIESPVAGLTRNRYLQLAYSANHGTVVVKLNGEVVAKQSGDIIGPLNDGAYTIEVIATDAAKLTGSDARLFTVDSTAPEVTITSPAVGPTNNRTPKLECAFNEGSVVVRVDNVLVNKQCGAVLDPLTDGDHSVVLEVTDAATNVSTASVNFTVDTVPPAVNITSPTGATSDNTPLLNYVVSDTASAVESVMVMVDGVVVNRVSGDSLEMLADGLHTLFVQATDAAKNIGSASIDFIVDTVPPVTVVDPDGGFADTGNPSSGAIGKSKAVRLQASEIATIYYTTNGKTPTVASSVYTGPISLAETTVLKFFAKDTATNTEIPFKEKRGSDYIFLQTTDPANKATGVLPAKKTFVYTFSRNIKQGDATVFATKIGLEYKDKSTGSINFEPCVATISNNTLYISVQSSSQLMTSTQYTVIVPANALQDATGQYYSPAYPITFTTDK